MGAASALVGGPAVAARLAPKPAYVQCDEPPLVFDGDAVGLSAIDGFRLRFRVCDSCVISSRY